MSRSSNGYRRASWWHKGRPARLTADADGNGTHVTDADDGRWGLTYMDPDPLHVAHGYTLTDLDQMTHAACIADRTLAMDHHTKRDIAWSAIALALCEAQTPPHRQELIRIGWQAIYRDVRDERRSHGVPDSSYGDYDVSLRPRFAMYWEEKRYIPSPENGIVERLAAHQVAARLRPDEMAAVVALAVHDDYSRAAEALGIGYSTLTMRLGCARRRWFRWWLEGETPYRPRRRDGRVGVQGKEPNTHCRTGHEWTPENTRWGWRRAHGRLTKRRYCRACESAHSKARVAARQQAKAADGLADAVGSGKKSASTTTRDGVPVT